MDDLLVHIQKDMCCGFGNCAMVCPSVFVLDYETNRAKCIDNASINAHADEVARAVEECPAQAIILLFTNTGP